MPDDNSSQYDFIMNPATAPKKRLLPSGSSRQSRIIIAVGGGIVLLLVLFMIFSLVFRGGPNNKDLLLSLAQQQNELIRVSDIGIKEARDPIARNLAQTTKLSLTGDQQPLLDALKAQNVKVGARELSAGKQEATDKMLTTAQQTNHFDEVFVDFMRKELTIYRTNIKEAYDTSTSSSLKAALATQYQNAGVLVGEEAEAN